MTEVAVTDIYNYHALDGLLSTSGQPSEDELRSVAADGFEVVINLALHDNPRYSLPDEPGLVTALGLTYVHIPVQFDAPTEGDLFAFFAAMEAHRDRRKLVHCAANKRVSSFVGLHRVIELRRGRDEAFALMRQVWEPDPVWSAFIEAMLAQHHA